ncbi:MAG: sulfur oxidation c-type cytochrome SoxX [Chromatiales bacterium]|nr:sulfur oxidation c-type cytochrome SoxX [Chromatiales bacterium]
MMIDSMTTCSRRLLRLLPMALTLALVAAPALAWETPPRPEGWTPGTPYPHEALKAFPCHDYNLPCGKLSSPPIQKVQFSGSLDGDAERGEKIAINIRWGNCLACHSLPKGHQGGSVGPDLSEYGKRNPPLDYVFQRIWDGRVFNVNAHMPIYGPNGVLNEQEIRDVMAFILSGK